ncbi:tetratricopeptide repeat protein [Aequorivita echinoideorum]|uniref:Tetratricopeptide repeat-containing protein n=1 Tax=Aequorivita echinoideorum TaxID=1549647 RepID=A0ABS5S0M8_9FLAO|nr:tetratricopeptide repeat protein [Aequorivita echinoideorum]MBT0606710.1 hypothetical protein [Aequorivita echinoideorum]
MKKGYLLLLLFFASLAPSLAQRPNIKRLTEQISKSINTKPDSAKIYIARLLENSEGLHDTILAKNYSNLGLIYNKQAVFDTSEFYIKKAIVFTKEYPLLQARQYMNLAINYRTASRYQDSFEALEKASELFKKANNKEGQGMVYGEMASNYNYMLDSEKAMEALKKAIKILTEAGNKREIYAVKQKLANVYYNSGDYTFAKELYGEVLPKFAEDKSTNYYYTLMNYSDCLMHFEEYTEAEKALTEVVAGLKARGNHEYAYFAISKLGLVYTKTNRFSKAKAAVREAYDGLLRLHSPRFMDVAGQYLEFLNSQNNFNEALAVIEDVKASSSIPRLKLNADNEIYFLRNAVVTYGNKGLTDKSIAAYERMDFLKDSVNDAVNKLKAKELQEAYQNDLRREQNLVLSKNNELLKENNAKERNIFILGILLLLLIIGIGISIYINNQNKLKLQKERVANLEISKKSLEEKAHLEGQLLQERSITLENKEKELVDISLEMANVQNKIIELVEARENPEASKKLASDIAAILKKHNYWKYFKNKFIEVHPDFASVLTEMFPTLSENDIAFCCMLRLQLSLKEIAALMGTSEHEIISKKEFIRSKMGLQHDEEAFEKLIAEV